MHDLTWLRSTKTELPRHLIDPRRLAQLGFSMP
jgi:hypothetical protein